MSDIVELKKKIKAIMKDTKKSCIPFPKYMTFGLSRSKWDDTQHTFRWRVFVDRLLLDDDETLDRLEIIGWRTNIVCYMAYSSSKTNGHLSRTKFVVVNVVERLAEIVERDPTPFMHVLDALESDHVDFPGMHWLKEYDNKSVQDQKSIRQPDLTHEALLRKEIMDATRLFKTCPVKEKIFVQQRIDDAEQKFYNAITYPMAIYKAKCWRETT